MICSLVAQVSGRQLNVELGFAEVVHCLITEGADPCKPCNVRVLMAGKLQRQTLTLYTPHSSSGIRHYASQHRTAMPVLYAFFSLTRALM